MGCLISQWYRKEVLKTGFFFPQGCPVSLPTVVSRLRAGRPKSFGLVPGGVNVLFILQNVQIGSEAHSVS
jgi:hypothetical protein